MSIKTAYCYCRVSSGKQAGEYGGWGMSRQQHLLSDYVDNYRDIKNFGYSLSVDSIVFLNAEGVSAFSEKNISEGSTLRTFISGVKSEKIKNAVLIVENLDRFSRANPQTAAMLFLDLIASGCHIHEAESEIVYHKNSDLETIAASFTRAYKESERKQKISIKNWDKRFEDSIKNKTALTKRCPSWLSIRNGKYIVQEEQARCIRLIFELYNKGFGQAYIRDELNRRNWLYNNNTWGSWNVHSVLNDIRVTGKHKTKSKLRHCFDGIMLYPVVVSELDFKMAQQKLKKPGREKKIGRRANNLFSGILLCGICKKAHILVNNDNGKRFGRCSYTVMKNGRCDARGFKFDIVERALLDKIRNFNLSEAIGLDNNNLELMRLQNELVLNKDYLSEVEENIKSVDIPTQLDYQIYKKLGAKIRDLELNIERLNAIYSDASRYDDVINSIKESVYDINNVSERQELNSHLRKFIKRIDVFRLQDTISFILEYFNDQAKQVLIIDSKSGEKLFDLYRDKNIIEISNNIDNIYVYDKNTSKGVFIGNEVKVNNLTDYLNNHHFDGEKIDNEQYLELLEIQENNKLYNSVMKIVNDDGLAMDIVNMVVENRTSELLSILSASSNNDTKNIT
ncbi:recombinase family protein [Edwardsiella tarda]|uniref:recombinase family protein n=1 Tax=Edwardsiella tarda TaxID=636 RepID=UPI00351C9A1C